MMDEIKERARTYAHVCKHFDCDNCDWRDCERRDLYEAYNEIATEQRRIDKEKATEFIVSTCLGNYVDAEGTFHNDVLARRVCKAMDKNSTETIEDRAYEHYPIRRAGMTTDRAEMEEGREGYIKGAEEQRVKDEEIAKRMVEEQRAKDIERACQWIFLNIGAYVNEQGYVETHVLEKDFRKAMEE